MVICLCFYFKQGAVDEVQSVNGTKQHMQCSQFEINAILLLIKRRKSNRQLPKRTGT